MLKYLTFLTIFITSFIIAPTFKSLCTLLEYVTSVTRDFMPYLHKTTTNLSFLFNHTVVLL